MPDAGKEAYRVILIEDNPHVLEIFQYAFRRLVTESLGPDRTVDVHVAEDGHDGWTKIASAEEPFDLIILDLMLPVLDGNEVLSRIRADSRLSKTPVVVITAGDDETCEAAKQRGANVVLRKPVQLGHIREAVTGLFGI